jgi:hypothetical protein
METVLDIAFERLFARPTLDQALRRRAVSLCLALNLVDYGWTMLPELFVGRLAQSQDNDASAEADARKSPTAYCFDRSIANAIG